MEKLALLINDQVRVGSWHPICLSKGGPAISYLFFAYDVLLFTKACFSQVRLVSKVLDDFCEAFWLKVNLAKSIALCSARVPSALKIQLAIESPIQFTRKLVVISGSLLSKAESEKQISISWWKRSKCAY